MHEVKERYPLDTVVENEEPPNESFLQYTEINDIYRPATKTISSLPKGLYITSYDNFGPHLVKYKIDEPISDLIEFEDNETNKIIKEAEVFWNLKEQYEKKGEPHKRGFLLWGPPGGGKTATIELLIKKFIYDYNGVVLLFRANDAFMPALKFISDIEPDRKKMIVMEDIDAGLHNEFYESLLLNLLDGDTKTSNVVFIATTNYPEKLPERIRNRPSRFDRIVFIDNPSFDTRKEYFIKKLENKDINIEQITKDTEGFSFAHMKELLLSIEVFKYDYDTSLSRLKNMMNPKNFHSNIYEERKPNDSKKGFGF